mgnify:CR=1 FL=1
MASKKFMISRNRRLCRPQYSAWRAIRGFCILLILYSAPLTHIAAHDGTVFRSDWLAIDTQNSRRTFQVEIAETAAQRAQGLMWRKHLPMGTGMLFDFKITSPVVMWMKNTYIPLDMFFITEQGVILNIVREAEPHSIRHIGSIGPVRAVLELPGGSAKQFGIRAGDRVDHAIFNP